MTRYIDGRRYYGNENSTFKTVCEAQSYCKKFGYEQSHLDCFEIADALKRAFDRGTKQSDQDRWISVEDRLPQKLPDYQRSKPVLIAKYHNIFWEQEIEPCFYDDDEEPGFLVASTTHWQSLPNDPKEKK